ncbi:MAG: polymer-forming cytoskeletal protein [Rhizobiales bacterium]|nr:polymer-forming cytoskeletal protein [Hyphomicrobiales bacterium]
MVPSIISGDLIISGNLLSGGELQVDGTIDGDVRASSLVIGEQATVTGEVMAEEVIIRGRVIGSVRGLRVVLAANCHVEGEIFHESLAVEPGAFFEGNCRRSEDPLARNEVDSFVPAPPVARAHSTGFRSEQDHAEDEPAPAQSLPEPAGAGQQIGHGRDQYADYESPEAAPVIVKDGRVVVRRSAAE